VNSALSVRVRTDKAEFTGYIRQSFLRAQQGALQRLFRASCLEAHGLVDGGALRTLLDAPPERQSALGLGNLAAMELWLQAPIRPKLDTHSLGHDEDRYEHV
jgi:hypothetical protein